MRNLLGEEVTRFRVNALYEGRIYWNTRNMDAGLYTVSLYNADGHVHTGRAIITR